ncbi:MAG: hypothetical protein HY244_07545 [Rhizobiales bacterium]|nr:hypothetical protein [Hyphomicrobiales bacterium]
MATAIAPPEPDLSNIRKLLGNRYPLWRLFGWGSAAAIALTCLVITTQTPSGSERLQLAFAPSQPSEQAVAAAQMPTRVIGIDKETVRLEAQLRVLAADRDRLAARLALIERNLDDMTGSIKRQAAQETATPAAKPPIPSTPATTQLAAAPASQPAIAQPPAMFSLPIIAPLSLPAPIYNPAPWPGTPAQEAMTPVLEHVPPPPIRMAAAPASEQAAETPRKPEIGVDLGGAPNMEVLNMRWVAVKANYGPLLSGLHPLAARVHRPGASDVRLLVGPLPTVTAANQLCARFAAARVTCRAVKFDGQPLPQL